MATPSRTVPKTRPLHVTFSLLERVGLRSQKEGIWGKKIVWGWAGQKKEKRMRKKRGVSEPFFTVKPTAGPPSQNPSPEPFPEPSQNWAASIRHLM